ncbi:MAG: hypothetical protein M1838_002688 [Thelocarpon superellum]|nr:MAG: hypothetical protein M1838_002688 [Thelocarpon superellum]
MWPEIHQVTHGNRQVDLGPNWIHGTGNNPILNLAKELGTSLHSWEDDQTLFTEQGELLDRAEAAKLSTIFWRMVAAAFEYSKDNVEAISPDDNLLEYFTSKLEGQYRSQNLRNPSRETAGASDSPSSTTAQDVANRVDLRPEQPESPQPESLDREIEHLSNRQKQRILWLAEIWGSFIGDSVSRQSLKFFWLEESIDGDNLFVASTYRAILDHVAEQPLSKAEMHFSKRATSIETIYEDRDKSSSGTAVTTSDGSTQRYDEVVLTAPLGWLKRNHSAFIPPLPHRLRHAIEAISYGRLEKVYMTFPAAFWEDADSSTGSTTSTDKPQASSESSTSGRSPPLGFAHWMHPTYAHTTNPASWSQQAVSLSTLPAPHNHATLLFYTHGACSTHLTTLLSSTDPSTHTSLLFDFFKPYITRLPYYSATSPTCIPIAVTATSWATDELAGNGSYSNFQTGLTDGDISIATMRDGLPDRRLWLAGEHTAPIVALGTVTGAYWSGETVAERVAAVYGMGAKETRGEEEETSVGQTI